MIGSLPVIVKGRTQGLSREWVLSLHIPLGLHQTPQTPSQDGQGGSGDTEALEGDSLNRCDRRLTRYFPAEGLRVEGGTLSRLLGPQATTSSTRVRRRGVNKDSMPWTKGGATWTRRAAPRGYGGWCDVDKEDSAGFIGILETELQVLLTGEAG